ncbi:MAG: acetoin dehydrogenase dihydrolipoyllysine-residue acetyltransferase subunit [Geminicoccaceae bacterium]|nr:acetoin dehydrogenase dihydrolipoyllysine-residue acetyltransferase subunit [Geminicoccaceae bacterium]
MSSGIEAIVMPKWGLAMQEGMLAAWSVEEGATITKGQEICDIETSKIANVFESPVSGTLRRRVTAEGETVPVGYLIAVCAPGSVDDAAIDAFVDDFKANFVVDDAGAGGPEPKTVETGAGRIRYLEAGGGDALPLIFIHGFGGDYLSWMLNQAELSADRTAYAIDLPGHGGSTKAVGQGDVGSLTAAVCAFMQAMDIARAHLVGHSLGGAIALDMVRNHPELVASATLIAPAALGPDIEMDYIQGFIREKRAKKLRPYLEMLVHDPSMISAEMVEEVIKFKRLDGAEEALNTIANNCFDGGRQNLVLTERLPRMTRPIQVMWGKNDRILSPGHSVGLPPSIDVTLLDDAGHLPHMEKAEQVNAGIEAFITRHDGP